MSFCICGTFYWLMNRAVWPTARKNITSLEGIYRERVGRIREIPCSCRRRKTLTGNFPVGQSLVVIHRAIKMG